MRFKVDENLPMEVAQVLRAAGHEAATVLDQHFGGSADSLIASICQQEERTLVTLDLDFADIRPILPQTMLGSLCFACDVKTSRTFWRCVHGCFHCLHDSP